MDKYKSMSEMVSCKDWVFTVVHKAYCDLVAEGMITWCEQNLSKHWTMCGATHDNGFKLGFECPEDAAIFHLTFGYSTK